MSRAFQFRIVNVERELSPAKANEEYTEKAIAYLSLAETLISAMAPYVVGYMVLNTISKVLIAKATTPIMRSTNN